MADYIQQPIYNMQFIKVTQHKGATILYINPQHIMLIQERTTHIDEYTIKGATLYHITGQHTKIDQSVEEVLALISQ